MPGSVWKRGKVWQITFDKPRGADGKRQQRQLSCPGMTKKQAEQRLADIQSAMLKGTYVDASTMNVSELVDNYLDYLGKSGIVADTTLDGYRKMGRNYIKPELGQILIHKLTSVHIRQFYSDLLDEKKYGLSVKTVKNVHGFLHSVLEDAVNMPILPRNPAYGVKPPRYIRPNIKVATREQLAQLMSSIDECRWRIPILIAMTTAMRRGEVCGLRWEDFDADRGVLIVRRDIVQVPGKVITKEETKNHRSRVLPIPQGIITELSAWRKKQLQEGKAQGGWICTHPDGRLITPESVGKGFLRLRRKLGISATLHGLRHTQATELIMSGVPVKVVSERLGHASVNITQDVYSHVLPHMQEKTLEIIDQMIRNETPKIKVVDGEC